MPDETGSTDDPKKLIMAAQEFFSTCPQDKVPSLLQSKGSWIVLRGGWFWALFYLSEPSLHRVREYQARKWHPFPGLFSPTETGSAFFVLDGKDAFLDSNVTQNGYAIRVGRKATFILHNHRHSVKDDQGNQAAYCVDLAFGVGVEAVADYQDLETAFEHLFQYFIEILSAGQ